MTFTILINGCVSEKPTTAQLLLSLKRKMTTIVFFVPCFFFTRKLKAIFGHIKSSWTFLLAVRMTLKDSSRFSLGVMFVRSFFINFNVINDNRQMYNIFGGEYLLRQMYAVYTSTTFEPLYLVSYASKMTQVLTLTQPLICRLISCFPALIMPRYDQQPLWNILHI